MTVLTEIIEDTEDIRSCAPQANDQRREPGRCVIANHIRDEHPWAKNVSVGARTIRIYDYRCEHNPDGLMGKCHTCGRRRLIWATPMPWAKAIKQFDRGSDPEFPALPLPESSADIETTADGRDFLKRREAKRAWSEAVRSGEHKPNTRSAHAKARAKQNRRNG